MHLHNKLFAFTLLLMPLSVFALPSDREQPINIEADHAQLDDKAGVTQYKGDAILTQGTLRLEGDIITFYYDENQQLIKAVAQGKRATYQQIHQPGEKPVRAKALQMEYYADRQKIYLLGQGYVWQNGDEFTGNRIEYDITRNVVVANSEPINVGGEQQGKGRIHIIIQPPKSSGKSSSTKPKATVEPKKATPAAVESEEKATSASEAEAYPTAVTTSNLNVRTGPSTQYQKLGVLLSGQEVIVLTRQPSWVQIRAVIAEEVVIGWVNSRYIK